MNNTSLLPTNGLETFSLVGDSRLKNKQGGWRTNTLFKEYRYTTEDIPLFTLNESEVDGLPSLRAIYLAYEDPTEYVFANKVFGSWECWKGLTECMMLAPLIVSWREELETRIKAKSLLKIVDKAGKGDYEANKFLVTRGWVEKTALRGRPSKLELKGALEKDKKLAQKIANDAEKMGVVIQLDNISKVG